VYLLVLFVWEVIPTYLIVFFFRVRLPSSSSVSVKGGVGGMRRKGGRRREKEEERGGQE